MCGHNQLAGHKRWLIANQIHIEDLSGHAIWSLVVLQGQGDAICVVAVKQALVKSDLTSRASLDDILSEFVKSLQAVHLHSLADSVLTLDMRQS